MGHVAETLACVLIVGVLVSQTRSQEKVPVDLYKTLLSDQFSGYMTAVRPVKDQARATVVFMTVHLLAVMEVSVIDRLGHEDLLLRVHSTGRVRWEPTGVFETGCSIDVTFYPFDTQRCTIMFQTEMSYSSEVRIRPRRLSLNFYTRNGQWELMNHSIKDNEGCVTTGISCAVVQLELRRRRFFYILNVILPVVFMSLTSSLVFALPADAGEKMGLSITVLLAYAVYLSLVTDAMPNTSMQASIMAVYLMLLLGLCAVNVVLIMAVYLMLLLGLCAVNVVLIMAVYLMLLLGLCAVNVVLTTFILRLHHRKDIVHSKVCYVITRLRPLLCFPDHNGKTTTEVVSLTSLELEESSDKLSAHARPQSRVVDSTGSESSISTRSGQEKFRKAVLSRKLGKGLNGMSLQRKLQDGEEEELTGTYPRKIRESERSRDSTQGMLSRKQTEEDVTEITLTGVRSSGTADKPFRTRVSPVHDKNLSQSKSTTSRPSLIPRSAEKPEEGKAALTGRVVAETLDYLLFLVSTAVSLGTTVLCVFTLVIGSATKAIDTSLV